MREIKFRAWDSEEKNYIFFDALDGILAECDEVYRQRCVGRFEQFTGLRDKNGKEIYEGDMLKETAPRGNVYRVFGVPGGFVINAFQDEITNLRYAEPLANMQTSGYIQEQCYIIGNIHENPELLNE
mgnify:CR=1 FL=1